MLKKNLRIDGRTFYQILVASYLDFMFFTIFLEFISCRWYHGRMDRYQSEERLRATNKNGSYLIRESDRKPGSYVLSYLGKTGINHFR